MDATLPQPVRLRLEKTLAAWSDWRPPPRRAPTTVEWLSGGRSNHSVRVSDGAGHWAVRLDGGDPARLGLDRRVEWECLQNAAAAGLAPQPVFRDASLGALVCDFHEPDLRDTGGLARVADLLRRIHALPAVTSVMKPLSRARLYSKLIGDRPLPTRFLMACKRLDDQAVPLRLCHNDLLRANRLASGGKLLALDWEYAAMGDPVFDVAAIIEGDGLTSGGADTLHSLWLGRQPTAREVARLRNQRLVYRTLASLWAAVSGTD